MVRTFIGIEIEASVIAEISQELSYLKNQFPNINWIKPCNIHLTLKYLGNIQPNDLRKVFESISEIGTEFAPFSIDIEKTSVLPTVKSPKVVSVGCSRGRDELIALQKKVDTACFKLGYDTDTKVFDPSFILGKIRQPSIALGIEEILIDMLNINFGISDVDEVVVFMSELTNTGAEYSPMHRIKLEG